MILLESLNMYCVEPLVSARQRDNSYMDEEHLWCNGQLLT